MKARHDEGQGPLKIPALNPQQMHWDSEPTEARNQRDRQDKLVSTAIARAALAGYTLLVVADGAGGSCFRIGRWCFSRSLGTIAEVEAFLDRAGGPDAPSR